MPKSQIPTWPFNQLPCALACKQRQNVPTNILVYVVNSTLIIASVAVAVLFSASVALYQPCPQLHLQHLRSSLPGAGSIALVY